MLSLGDWLNGKIDGFGIYYSSNKRVYKGKLETLEPLQSVALY